MFPRTIFSVILTSACWAPALSLADDAGAVTPARPVSFRQDVLPALTKAGCNSGQCHGTPAGRGGFAISLRGYDPVADLKRLTRDFGARRINVHAPDESLVLLKATARVPHGGGLRFKSDDPLYRLLADWIAADLPDNWQAEPAVVDLEIQPATRWLEPAMDRQQLTVRARLDDGTVRDVTYLAYLSVSDEEAAEIAPDGMLRRIGGGEVTVSAAYGELQAAAQVVFLPERPGFAWTDPPEHNAIDRHVFAKLEQLRIAPSELADDATFLRRAYLDICGILPTPIEGRAFLAGTRPNKRAQLIDALLERPEYADHWAMKWTDRLGCNQRFVGKIGALKYHAWIRHQIATNVPDDRFVRSIITASGGNYTHPPAGFYRLPRTPEDRAEQVAQVFMGVRIGCARCHNHPGERWTQDDYYGLAACFAQMKYRDGPFFIQKYDKEETILTTREGDVVHSRTGARMPPKPLGGTPFAAEQLEEADRRELLAAWLATPENPFFARAMANQIWFQLFGRGIVEPVDDFRSSNPPSNAALLDWLARDYAASGFDRKRLIRQIMLSRTYQLSSQTNSTNAADERYFSHARIRQLGAEQLLDCIGQATLSPEKFTGFPAGLRAAQLADGEYNHVFLSTFGRPARSLACACERESDSNLGQALELIGGKLIETKIGRPQGRVALLIDEQADSATMVEECFLATLSRLPTKAEQESIASRLDASSDHRATAEDLLWSLINHPGFLFQH
jgi:hypothetical protein